MSKKCDFCMPDRYIDRNLRAAPYTRLLVGYDWDKLPYIYASGDNNTPSYDPRFCPECGRRLRFEEEEEE